MKNLATDFGSCNNYNLCRPSISLVLSRRYQDMPSSLSWLLPEETTLSGFFGQNPVGGTRPSLYFRCVHLIKHKLPGIVPPAKWYLKCQQSCMPPQTDFSYILTRMYVWCVNMNMTLIHRTVLETSDWYHDNDDPFQKPSYDEIWTCREHLPKFSKYPIFTFS